MRFYELDTNRAGAANFPLVRSANINPSIWIKNEHSATSALNPSEALSLTRSVILGPAGSSHTRVLAPSEVRWLKAQFGKFSGQDYERIYFGHKLSQAIDLGFSITNRGYFEATESPAAIHTAVFAATTIKDTRNEPISKLSVFDLFSGTGQMLWAFSKCGYEVLGCELDHISYEVTKKNLCLIAPDLASRIKNIDGVAEMHRRIDLGDQFDLVYLDPPWNGTYQYKMDSTFNLEFTVPNAKCLVLSALRIASIVALKCPLTVNLKQVEEFALDNRLDVLICRQIIPESHPSLSQATLLFRTGGRGSYRVLDFEMSKSVQPPRS